jgi:hypothetical protein
MMIGQFVGTQDRGLAAALAPTAVRALQLTPAAVNTVAVSASQAALAKVQAARASMTPHWERAPAGVAAGDTVCGYIWVGQGAGPDAATWPAVSTCTAPRVHTGPSTPPPQSAPLPPCGMKNAKGVPITPCDPSQTLPTTIAIGPFAFAIGKNLSDHRNTYTQPSQLLPAQQAWLATAIEPHISDAPDKDSTGADKWHTLSYWFPSGLNQWWKTGQTIDADYTSADGTSMPNKPLIDGIANITDPGVAYGLYLFISGDGNNNAPKLQLRFAKSGTTVSASTPLLQPPVISSPGTASGVPGTASGVYPPGSFQWFSTKANAWKLAIPVVAGTPIPTAGFGFAFGAVTPPTTLTQTSPAVTTSTTPAYQLQTMNAAAAGVPVVSETIGEKATGTQPLYKKTSFWLIVGGAATVAVGTYAVVRYRRKRAT